MWAIECELKTLNVELNAQASFHGHAQRKMLKRSTARSQTACHAKLTTSGCVAPFLENPAFLELGTLNGIQCRRPQNLIKEMTIESYTQVLGMLMCANLSYSYM